MNDFEQAVEVILKLEGGYVNDTNDPGGETNMGICKRAYPDVDIKNITVEQAKIIYKRDYWDKVRGDLIAWPLSLYLFDSAVNQGVDAAIKLLQKSASVAQDGILGVNTLAVIKKTAGIDTSFMAERALRYTGTRNFDKYGRGWMKRLFQITQKGLI